MFLSKIALVPSHDTKNELARLQKNGVYASHQLLWKLFTEENERPFLFREEQASNGMPEYYVLSEKAPKTTSPLFHIQSKPFAPILSSGQRLAYKLRVNPTICMTDKQGKQRRHDVMMHAKRCATESGATTPADINLAMEQAAIAWLANKPRLERWGITLDSAPLIECYTQHRSDKKHNHTIRFSSVDFDGVLTVQDPTVFLSQYQQGFGRARGLGCGLMLIRPI